MSDSKITTYEGKDVDMTWDDHLCIHIDEYRRSTDKLFLSRRKPWCQPNMTDMDDMVNVIEHCPTGALVHLRKDSVRETTASKNTIVVTNHGPLYAHGDLHIKNAPDDAPNLRFRTALCQCEQSKNKPYCDNSHEKTKFRDHDTVGQKDDDLKSTNDPLKISPTKNDPFIAKGNLTIITSSGRPTWKGTKAFLYHCNKSKNKPFYDGTHTKVSFHSK